MSNDQKLAIIIPAYKATFFHAALESIANQSCSNFNVYVGDDASPSDIKSIVDKFVGKINIHYHRFEENLGHADLAGHWNRCLALSHSEEWIWLFSDDDIMQPHCVENFFQIDHNHHDVFFFDTSIIDDVGRVLENQHRLDQQSFDEFLHLRYTRSLNSYAIEYIFRRSALERINGFFRSDLAWCSDDATLIQLAFTSGFKKISPSRVYWRKSNCNISPNVTPELAFRKLVAFEAYDYWNGKTFNTLMLTQKLRFLWFFACILELRKGLTIQAAANMMKKFLAKRDIKARDATRYFLHSIFYMTFAKLKSLLSERT